MLKELHELLHCPGHLRPLFEKNRSFIKILASMFVQKAIPKLKESAGHGYVFVTIKMEVRLPAPGATQHACSDAPSTPPESNQVFGMLKDLMDTWVTLDTNGRNGFARAISNFLRDDIIQALERQGVTRGEFPIALYPYVVSESSYKEVPPGHICVSTFMKDLTCETVLVVLMLNQTPTYRQRIDMPKQHFTYPEMRYDLCWKSRSEEERRSEAERAAVAKEAAEMVAAARSCEEPEEPEPKRIKKEPEPVPAMPEDASVKIETVSF